MFCETANKISIINYFCRVIYDACLEWFDAVTDKKDKTEGKRPNRRICRKES